MNKTYQLLDFQGKPYESTEKGSFGGHKKLSLFANVCVSREDLLAFCT